MASCESYEVGLRVQLVSESNLRIVYHDVAELLVIMILNRMLEGDVFVSPEQLVDCGREGELVDLRLMELDVERIGQDGGTVRQHRAEQVMVVLLESIVELGLLKIEFDAKYVQDFKLPVDGEGVPGEPERVEELDHNSIHFLELPYLFLGVPFEQRIVHGRMIDEVGVEERAEKSLRDCLRDAQHRRVLVPSIHIYERVLLVICLRLNDVGDHRLDDLVGRQDEINLRSLRVLRRLIHAHDHLNDLLVALVQVDIASEHRLLEPHLQSSLDELVWDLLGDRSEHLNDFPLDRIGHVLHQ